MNANDDDAFGAFIRKLERMAPLEEPDRQAIRSLPFETANAGAGSFLAREGDTAEQCCVILTGYVCWSKTTSEGARQIVSFHVPGDIVDLQHLLLSRADHNIQTITDVTYATVPSGAVKRLAQDRPLIGEALWRDSLIDASVFREWVLNVGRRDAKSRVAHMLCEFAVRRENAGLGSPTAFELPMTQEHIADATGLTVVNVNRMLASLAADGLMTRDQRQVEIMDWPGMQRVADFDPAYLHLAAAA